MLAGVDLGGHAFQRGSFDHSRRETQRPLAAVPGTFALTETLAVDLNR